MSKTKMTVRIHENLFAWLQGELQALPLRQDALLDHLIATETPALAEDLKGLKLSPVAKRYISGELKRMNPKPVSICVRKSTQEALDAVMKETNIVRDAFINRMLVFLRASPIVLDHLGVPQFVEQIGQPRNGFVFRFETAPLRAFKTLLNDPFLFLREARAEDPEAQGLYRVLLPWKAFNCYMDDVMVPTSADGKEFIRALDSLQEEEETVFGRARSGGAK
jgi:hypothetical protein